MTRKGVTSIPRGTYGIDIFASPMMDGALSRYQDAAPAVQDMLRLAVAIASVQARAYEMLGPAPVGQPDTTQATKEPPNRWFERVLGSVVEAIVDNSPAESSQLRDLAARLDGFSFDVVLAAARGDDSALAQVLGPDSDDPIGDSPSPAVGLYVLRSTLQPYLAWLYAADSGRLEGSVYPARRVCPACGGSPGLGKHAEEDGLRLLRCSVCGHEWAYPRLNCVACDETDPGRIEVAYANEDQGRRLYMCKTCRRYVKISDERLLDGAVYLPLEDMLTLHLDELAKDRGYVPVAGGELDQAQAMKPTE